MTIFRYTRNPMTMGGNEESEKTGHSRKEINCDGMLAKIGCKFDPAIVGAIVIILAIMFVVWAFNTCSGFSDSVIPAQWRQNFAKDGRFMDSKARSLLQGEYDHIKTVMPSTYDTFPFPGNQTDGLGWPDVRHTLQHPFGQGTGKVRRNVQGDVNFEDGTMVQVVDSPKGAQTQSDSSNMYQAWSHIPFTTGQRSKLSHIKYPKNDQDLAHFLNLDSPSLRRKTQKTTVQPAPTTQTDGQMTSQTSA